MIWIMGFINHWNCVCVFVGVYGKRVKAVSLGSTLLMLKLVCQNLCHNKIYL